MREAVQRVSEGPDVEGEAGLPRAPYGDEAHQRQEPLHGARGRRTHGRDRRTPEQGRLKDILVSHPSQFIQN